METLQQTDCGNRKKTTKQIIREMRERYADLYALSVHDFECVLYAVVASMVRDGLTRFPEHVTGAELEYAEKKLTRYEREQAKGRLSKADTTE